MGNCAPKPQHPRSPATAATPPPVLLLYGSDSCPATSLIRAALLYKNIPSSSSSTTVRFVPFDGPVPFLKSGPDTVAGTADSLLHYLDAKLGGTPIAASTRSTSSSTSGGGVVGEVVVLQHRSMERHAAALARRAADMVEGEGGRMAEARRMGRRYGELVEVLLEHARMEELVLFPALERADDGGPEVCRLANEEHGRDLPIMNGIKEDFKSLLTMKLDTRSYDEALLNLSLRLNTLQKPFGIIHLWLSSSTRSYREYPVFRLFPGLAETASFKIKPDEHCKEHFAAEERDLVPLLEAAERDEGEEPRLLTRSSMQPWAEQVMNAMETSHSRLFPFFMSGLLPEEALQYIHLVCRYTTDRPRLVKMLQSLISHGKPPQLSRTLSTPLKSQFSPVNA